MEVQFKMGAKIAYSHYQNLLSNVFSLFRTIHFDLSPTVFPHQSRIKTNNLITVYTDNPTLLLRC